MTTYRIHLATMSYKTARALLEAKGCNIIGCNKDRDIIWVESSESPAIYFDDIKFNPHVPTAFVW